jgi:hypothetical protein
MWHSIWRFILHSDSLSGILSDILSGILLLAFYLAFLKHPIWHHSDDVLTFYLAFCLLFYLTHVSAISSDILCDYIPQFYLTYMIQIFWHSISSGGVDEGGGTYCKT